MKKEFIAGELFDKKQKIQMWGTYLLSKDIYPNPIKSFWEEKKNGGNWSLYMDPALSAT